MDKKLPIWAVSGFLGLKSDWDMLNMPQIEPFAMQDISWQDLKELGGYFCSLSQKRKVKPILMGYSMGARAVMHAIIESPEMFSGAIIISGHTGLQSTAQKKLRWQNDQKWAAKFLNQPWKKLIEEWNDQPVFTKGLVPARLEADFCRKTLAQIMLKGSLSKQKELTDQICNLKLPILWITGFNDEKYKLLAKKLKLSYPRSKKIAIYRAGHRVQFEQPAILQAVLSRFVH